MSIANWGGRLWRGAARAGASGANPKSIGADVPSHGAGLRACSVEDLLADHKDVIARIKLCYGCDNATFHADLLQPVQNYAAYVNALPATRASYYSGPGGLLRLGLETAFYALQATDSQIFAGRQTISSRRVLEPRWRRAVFLAGLCGELYRCLGQVKVRDAQGDAWQPYLAPLTAWLRQRRCASFTVHWSAGPERRALGVFALPMIVPGAMLEDLAHGNEVIVPNLLASVSGMATYHEHNLMDRLVRHAAALVIARERRLSGEDAIEDDVPVHLARHLVEAMRELVQSDHNWLPNAPRSRLWYGQDGLYLVWPNGAADIIRLLADERLPGAPDNAPAVLAILVADGIVAETGPGQSIVLVQPPGAHEPMEAVRIVPPSLLLADVVPPPRPLEPRLAVPPDTAQPPGKQPESDQPDSLLAEAQCASPVSETYPAPAPARKRPAKPHAGGETGQTQLPLPDIQSSGEAVQGIRPVSPSRREGRPRSAEHGAHVLDRVTSGTGQPALCAPLRLNRTVAGVLSAIVGTLHGDRPQCHVVDGALFVPLAALAAHGVDARQAWRSLDDAGMLVQDDSGEGVQTEQIAGSRIPGVRIAARFVTGLPTAPDKAG
ncbi:MobH family relaxase [Pseudoduganella sp. UC29_71]|uniref:MobH family relaxase n=1 Tax=Pseudoduganella sp. UC29_71 TaxID=3350174 RepID=UPI00366E1FB4